MQVFFPYDADLVETLKALIPSSARRWDPTEKSWWVLEAFRFQLQELLQDYGLDVALRTNRRPSVNAGAPLEALFQAIPANLRNKVYRQLAVALHPESGGTNELMKELNVAFDKFK